MSRSHDRNGYTYEYDLKAASHAINILSYSHGLATLTLSISDIKPS